MSIKYLLCISGIMVLLLAACNPVSAQPTISMDDIYATAIEIAKTSFAETSQALATPTLLPTDTPLPSQTATPEETGIATAISTSTGSDEMPPELPFVTPRGPLGRLKLENDTGQDILLVLSSATYYNELRFTRGYTIEIPLGYYDFYGYIGDKRSFSGTFHISDTIHAWRLYFGKNIVKVFPP